MIPDWNAGLAQVDWDTWGAFDFRYLYFGHTEKLTSWLNSAAQAGLTQRDLDPSKVLMSDQIFYANGALA